MYLRRLQQSQRIQQGMEQRSKFEANLRHESLKTEQQAVMSPAAKEDAVRAMRPPVIKTNPEIRYQPMPPVAEEAPTESTPQHGFASEAERAAYRRGKKHGFRYMVQANRGLHSNRMGWVMTEIRQNLRETAPRVSAPMIELDDVCLTLGSRSGDVNILRGIDLSVARGETVSVVGPSGSGKTSMLMIVAGLERATGGRVVVGGQDYGTLDEDGLALFRRDNIGIVFQSFHLIPTMTALENVAVPLELGRRRRARARAAEMLDAVGLGHRLHHMPGQLSGGEQQRVALARAFAPEPALVLADEPTGNLDGATGTMVVDLMFSLSRDSGTTLMLITHDRDLAAQCDRRVAMTDGLLDEG